MEHFSVVQSICRAGLATGDVAVRKQVERLKARLSKGGDATLAEDLERLLSADETATELVPSRVELSKNVPGERLTATVIPPHDRESSSPLAEVIMPGDGVSTTPILNDDVRAVVDALAEEWSQHEELRAIGVMPTRTCLLFGEPGTGKTLTALHIARQMGLPVVLVRLDGMMSSLLGNTARNIGALFEFANRYKCILLLDEFDALAKLRDDPQEIGEIKRVVNTLLQSLDTRSELGLTIAITNHPRLLDPAIWRRFEVKVQMPLPQEDQRSLIIQHFLHPLSVPDIAMALLSWVTEGATGSEIEGIAKALKRFSILQKEGAGRGTLETHDVIAALQRYYISSAKLGDRSKLALLREEPRLFAKALLESGRLGFNQTSVALLMGKDQATISRWVRGE